MEKLLLSILQDANRKAPNKRDLMLNPVEPF